MNMKLSLVLGAAALMLATAGSADAQSSFKPRGPVDLVVHTGAGGGNDAFGRAVIVAMQKDGTLPFNMVVLNKTGGGSINAMTYMKGKEGDTQTLALFSSVWVSDGLVQEAAPVQVDQLTPIALQVIEPGLVVVRADSPYKTLKDFVDAAKASPGKLKQAGGSVLSRDAVVRYVLMANTGANWSFISFPSGGERVSAVLGGHVDLLMIEPSEAGELIRSGKLRAIAQIADKRIEGFPDVPTIKEAGFNVPNVPQARGLVGPPGMPAEAVAYYQDIFQKASQGAAYKAYLKSTQLENTFEGAAQLGTFLKNYTNELREILKGAGVKVVR
jgi:putative tricarboxylic transport membrane protein